MLPIAPGQCVDAMGDRTRNLDRDVAGQLAASKADSTQHPARLQQVTDATERRGHLHVMKRGNCRHDIEGRRLERVRQEVATHIADPVIRILGLGQLDARLVEIDAGDVGHAPPKLAREHALTAADVECSPRPVRDSIKDQRIVVNVVIPPVSRSRHSPIVPLARPAPVSAQMAVRTCAMRSVHIIEHALMSERTMDGLAAARARGRTGGQKPKLTPRQARIAQAMYDETGSDGKRRYTVAQIAAEFGVTRPTIYRALQCLTPAYEEAEQAVGASGYDVRPCQVPALLNRCSLRKRRPFG